jgi:hypothetical protein
VTPLSLVDINVSVQTVVSVFWSLEDGGSELLRNVDTCHVSISQKTIILILIAVEYWGRTYVDLFCHCQILVCVLCRTSEDWVTPFALLFCPAFRSRVRNKWRLNQDQSSGRPDATKQIFSDNYWHGCALIYICKHYCKLSGAYIQYSELQTNAATYLWGTESLLLFRCHQQQFFTRNKGQGNWHILYRKEHNWNSVNCNL